MSDENTKEFVEDCWFLHGFRVGRYYFAVRRYHSSGHCAGVEFDFKKAFKKSVIGWYHTHPGVGNTKPSSTDHETMRSWVRGMGRRMLCGISSGDEQECHLFQRNPLPTGLSTLRRRIVHTTILSNFWGPFFFGREHSSNYYRLSE